MDRHTVLVRQDAARADLLTAIAGLDEATMASLPVVGNWTIKEVLAHIAGWAVWDLAAIRQVQAGEQPDFAALQDVTSFNARHVEERRNWTVTEILDEMDATRTALEELLMAIPEEDIFRVGQFRGPHWENLAGWLRVAREHEEEHAVQLRAWRTAVTTI
jgi:hypothetical protein